METCPPEIIDIIATHLTKCTFFHCLRVSKTWTDIFIPFLWRNFRALTPKQLRALGTPEFSAAVLRYGRHIMSLHIGSYKHLKPFLQELPPPFHTPSKAPMDNYATVTHTAIPCVQNLRKFELSIRRKSQREETTETLALLLEPSTSPTTVFAYSLDVSLDDPSLVLQLLKNNPRLLTLEFEGFNFALEWFLKRDRLLVDPSSSCMPLLSSLAQLTPNLKDLTLHSFYTPYRQLFRYQVELLARFLFQLPKTVETLVLSSRLGDVMWQRAFSSSTPSSHPVDNTAHLTESTTLTGIDMSPPTGPLAVQKVDLRFFAPSEDNPQSKTFQQSLRVFLRRCVQLKELSVGICHDTRQDAIVRHIIGYLVEARLKMLTILSVEVTLQDTTLAWLLNCTRPATKDIDTRTDSMDMVRFQGDHQDFQRQQEQRQEYRQCGWRVLKLYSNTTLGPLSSAALGSHFPTLKSLDVVECYSCPSQVLATLLISSPGLETLTTIEDRKGGSDDYEYNYNFIDARHLLEMGSMSNTRDEVGWACIGLQTLKAVISNVPRPDCERTHYRARLMPARNGTEGLTGDIKEQALRTQREICRQLGRLKQLRVLWLGYETRDFENLENYRVTPDERREELGLPKKDPNAGDNSDEEEEEEEEEEDVAMGEGETEGEGDNNDGEEEDEEEEDEHDDEYDAETHMDKHGNLLMYPLLFLNPQFQYSCLPLSLDSGLDLMSELKELRELNIEQMAHRIGLEEVQWMVANWPKLNRIIGLNVKDETIEAVEWLKKERPWIELPESRNSMRQSTWVYYYPRMWNY
ncbi:hypothetical protein BG015_006870 [Linnemannia schmuckeri]|uniref:F-box domain-containing protein n=1 Tax=Linnemannia schmuckeri TaxID=64567 RepID=A0A9P5S1Z7_9FUNG|nr:hypothetical protein BG015_006870 [Linnemannia schmuckeri]